MSKKEHKVPDIKPVVIDTVRFVFDNWLPLAERSYVHKRAGGKGVEGSTTDKNGYVQAKKFTAGDGNIKLKAEGAVEDNIKGGNPGPIEALKLRNKADGGGGYLRRGDSRQEDVKKLQKMLKVLGYYLGHTGPDKDGVDGNFGSDTEDAVRLFQEAHKDWEGKKLSKDGRVGPKTGDALNRALVGVWYKKYETPRELTKSLKLLTLTEKLAVDEGVNL